MGKSAWDLAVLLTQVTDTKTDYTSFIDPTPRLGKYRLGLGRAHFPTGNVEATALFDSAVRNITANAGSVLDPADIPCVPDILANKENTGWDDGVWQGRTEDLCVITEIYKGVRHFLERLDGCQIKTISELMRWNKEHQVWLCPY